jgi:hypothetical protein
MKKLFLAMYGFVICALCILFFWPLLVVVGQYWTVWL